MNAKSSSAVCVVFCSLFKTCNTKLRLSKCDHVSQTCCAKHDELPLLIEDKAFDTNTSVQLNHFQVSFTIFIALVSVHISAFLVMQIDKVNSKLMLVHESPSCVLQCLHC